MVCTQCRIQTSTPCSRRSNIGLVHSLDVQCVQRFKRLSRISVCVSARKRSQTYRWSSRNVESWALAPQIIEGAKHGLVATNVTPTTSKGRSAGTKNLYPPRREINHLVSCLRLKLIVQKCDRNPVLYPTDDSGFAIHRNLVFESQIFRMCNLHCFEPHARWVLVLETGYTNAPCVAINNRLREPLGGGFQVILRDRRKGVRAECSLPGKLIDLGDPRYPID